MSVKSADEGDDLVREDGTVVSRQQVLAICREARHEADAIMADEADAQPLSDRDTTPSRAP